MNMLISWSGSSWGLDTTISLVSLLFDVFVFLLTLSSTRHPVAHEPSGRINPLPPQPSTLNSIVVSFALFVGGIMLGWFQASLLKYAYSDGLQLFFLIIFGAKLSMLALIHFGWLVDGYQARTIGIRSFLFGCFLGLIVMMM